MAAPLPPVRGVRTAAAAAVAGRVELRETQLRAEARGRRQPVRQQRPRALPLPLALGWRRMGRPGMVARPRQRLAKVVLGSRTGMASSSRSLGRRQRLLLRAAWLAWPWRQQQHRQKQGQLALQGQHCQRRNCSRTRPLAAEGVAAQPMMQVQAAAALPLLHGARRLWQQWRQLPAAPCSRSRTRHGSCACDRGRHRPPRRAPSPLLAACQHSSSSSLSVPHGRPRLRKPTSRASTARRHAAQRRQRVQANARCQRMMHEVSPGSRPAAASAPAPQAAACRHRWLARYRTFWRPLRRPWRCWSSRGPMTPCRWRH